MPALYEQHGGSFVATEFTRGPWDPGAEHGGPAAALLTGVLEREAGGPHLPICRVTFELLRPVPLGELHVDVSVLRPGRKVQLLEGSIRTPDGTEVVRARALRVTPAPVSAGVPDPPPPGPDGVPPEVFEGTWSEAPMFPGQGIELRFVDGTFMDPGRSTAWLRLRMPVVAGERPTPLQRLMCAADFPNGTAAELDWGAYVFINPDLSVFVEREPVGEWIGLEARMRVTAGGVGVSEAVLYDERGRVGRSVQSLYVAAR